MQSVITHPSGVREGIEAAREQIDVSADDVDAVVTRSQRLTSLERLEIYANAYYLRLLECLREEFPGVRHALGEDRFDGYAMGYLQEFPSQSYTLGQLGVKFPQFLEQQRAVLERHAPNDVPHWPQFVIDLARLERIDSEVFDGPGYEGQSLLDPAALQQVPQESLTNLRFTPVPCLRLMTVCAAVHSYSLDVRNGGEPKRPAEEPTFLVVTRRDYKVRRFAVTAAAHDVLGRLIAGETLGDALGCLHDYDIPTEDLADTLQHWFREWTANGFFEQIQVEPNPQGSH